MSRRKVRKIRRRGPTVFNRNTRRKKILKNIATVVFALMIIPAGFFAAKYILEGVEKTPADTSRPGATGTTTASGPAATTTQKDTGDKNSAGGIRAFYLTLSQLRDSSLDSLLSAASQAGFNAAVFDLKDAKGALNYKSQTDFAKRSRAITDNALTIEQLKALIQKFFDKNITPIPRLYAFRDHTSPHHLPTAKITVESYPSYTWLDDYKEKGGKPWLNPYAPDAHSYIIGLAEELAETGFKSIMLDGVQFPNQTAQADYGDSELRSLSHIEVLRKFVADLGKAVGEGCRVMQTMPGLSAFGDGTEPFGGNPVTLGADTVSPLLMPSGFGNSLKVGETTVANPLKTPYDAVRLAAGQIRLRLELIDQNERPAVMPWLQADDYSAEQIKLQIKAVLEEFGQEASYILYNQKGSYDFGALAK
ncbi:MAG: hypothetical protein GX136_01910 [Clostridiales bacterium]|jgi:hypothetical protein|nr:hypothetical protein [Clostridiales bacterium]